MCGGGPPPGTSCDSTALTTPPVSRPWMRMTIGMPRMFTCLPPSSGMRRGFILETRPCCGIASFVRDGRAGRACEVDDFKSFEPGFAAPFAEIRAGIVERVAEFNEHVQRHEQALDVLAP